MAQINTLLINTPQHTDVKGYSSTSKERGQSGGDDFSKMVERHLFSEKSGNNQTVKANNRNETPESKTYRTDDNKVDAQKADNKSAENGSSTQEELKTNSSSEASNENSSNSKELIDDETNSQNNNSDTQTNDEAEQSQQFMTLLNESDKVLQSNGSVIDKDAELETAKESAGKPVDEQASLKLLLAQQNSGQNKLEGNASSYQGGNKEDIAKAGLKQDQIAGKSNLPKEVSEIGVINDKIAEKVTGEEEVTEGFLAKNVNTKENIENNKAQQLAAKLLSGNTTEATENVGTNNKADQSQLAASIELLKAQSALMDKDKKPESKPTLSMGSEEKAAKAIDDLSRAIKIKNDDKILENPLNKSLSRVTAEGLDFIKQSTLSKNIAATPTLLPENTLSKSSDSDSELIDSANADGMQDLEFEKVISQQNSGIENFTKDQQNQAAGSKTFLADPLFNANATTGVNSLSGQERQEQLLNFIDNQITNDKIQSAKSSAALGQEIIAIHSKDFTGAVKDKVMFMINQKLHQVEIRLDPSELGSMHIRLNLQNEQAVVNFVVQNQQAKDALDENLGKLKEMLAESGVDVGESNVEQQGQQADNNSFFGRGSNSKGDSLEDTMIDSQNSIIHGQVVKASASGVDYYA